MNTGKSNMENTGAEANSSKKSLLKSSLIVKNQWKIQEKIGQGAFGETYAATDIHTNESVAIKVEKLDNKKMILKLEVIALKKLQSCPYVVRYVHSGRQEDFNYLVMERLGENLAELRRNTIKQCFSMATTLRLGIQMIESLEGVHKLGYIHRDVKPSNYVIGKDGNTGRAYLIDFGLARKYRLPNGDIRPPRKNAGFRGTARYASINSHSHKELGRRDDLWSVFYVLVEFSLGSLPWRKMKDKEHIGELKKRMTNADLVKDLPKEYLLFMEHLKTLSYADEPNYDYLKSLLTTLYQQQGYSDDEPWDWATKEHTHMPPSREIQSIMDEPIASTNPTNKRPSPLSTITRGNVESNDEFYGVGPAVKSSNNIRRPTALTSGSSPKPGRFNTTNKNFKEDDEMEEQKPSCYCSIM